MRPAVTARLGRWPWLAPAARFRVHRVTAGSSLRTRTSHALRARRAGSRLQRLLRVRFAAAASILAPRLCRRFRPRVLPVQRGGRPALARPYARNAAAALLPAASSPQCRRCRRRATAAPLALGLAPEQRRARRWVGSSQGCFIPLALTRPPPFPPLHSVVPAPRAQPRRRRRSLPVCSAARGLTPMLQALPHVPCATQTSGRPQARVSLRLAVLVHQGRSQRLAQAATSRVHRATAARIRRARS